jgi:glycosyltransferase involved in cell wall biosynthesis
MRGGEKVLEELLDLFPEADIYTHVYDPDSVSEKIKSHNIYTTGINKLPLAKKLYQKYMPLMPNALQNLNLQEYDLIISSESGPAKGVVPNPGAFHLCYCHSPMRYCWDMYNYYYNSSNFLVKFFMKKFVPSLRSWDILSSNLVDHFAANSQFVAKRIKRYYNRTADVVHPPVDINKYNSVKRTPEDYYLFFGQLTGYKRADIAVEACLSLKRKLVIIGAGAGKKEIKKYKNNGLITFKGHLNDREIGGYLARAKALLFPGIEDFGIVPIEANAAGCPVIAYKDGGALETIKENVTGIFFDEQTVSSLSKAIIHFESIENNFLDRQPFNEHVSKFSKEKFRTGILNIINEKNRL